MEPMKTRQLTATDVAEGISELATFPDVPLQLSRALNDAHTDAGDIAGILESDPALSATLLKVANSASYGASRTVDNIGRAVNMVGFKVIQELSFGVSAMKTFDGIPNELITVKDFWHHSLLCAAASQNLADALNVCRNESLLTMGLLHDIGQLAMFNYCPDLARQALSLSLDENDGLALHESERKLLGFDHCDVGQALAEQWHFPANIQRAIFLHHQFSADEDVSDSAMLVHIGNSVASLAELDSDNLSDVPRISEIARERFELTDGLLMEIKQQAIESAEELLSIFER